MRRKRNVIKDTFIAHAGNNHHPHLFSMWGVVGTSLALILIASAPLVQKKIDMFAQLAAVLPTALFEETNTVRAEQHLPAVAFSDLLNKAAQAKAEDMVLRGYFSHNSPEGLAPWLWLDTVGYAYSYAGENLAIHFTESSDVVKAWVASPKHYENLVKPEYTEMGLGVAHGVLLGQETTVVVQFFATPAAPEEKVSIVATTIKSITSSAEASGEPKSPHVAGSATQRDVSEPVPAHITDVPSESNPDNYPILDTSTAVTAEPAYAHASVTTQPFEEPSYVELFLDSMYEYTMLLLFAFLFSLIALYAFHYGIYRVHIPHLAFGSVALGVVSLSLVMSLWYGRDIVVLPLDTQAASVVISL